jgi:hypothetical protein
MEEGWTEMRRGERRWQEKTEEGSKAMKSQRRGTADPSDLEGFQVAAQP